MKKIICIFLITIIGIVRLAAQTINIDGIVYKVTSVTEPYTVEIIAIEPSCSGSISIPEKVNSGDNYFLVTSIREKAFVNCQTLNSVVIPNSITNIGESAFEKCSNLVCISIPNSVTHIKAKTFADCTSLKSISISNSVSSIGPQAFYNCINLTSVEIPTSVKSTDATAFEGCTQLKFHQLPESKIVIDFKKREKKFKEYYWGIKAAYHSQDKPSYEFGGFYTLSKESDDDNPFSLGFNASAEFFKGGLINFPKLTIAMNIFPEVPFFMVGFKFSYSRYIDQNLSLSGSAFTPEIGVTLIGILNFSYGHHSFTGEDFGLSQDQFSITLYIPLSTNSDIPIAMGVQ